MNRYILRIALAMGAVSLAGAASAADLPSAAPAPAPYIATPPIFTWTGFYIGLNAGWVGSANGSVTNVGTDTGAGGLGTALATGAIPTSLAVNSNGFLGGAQLGYNWQNGAWVFGVEGDIDGTSASHSVTVGPITIPGFVPQTSVFSRSLDWFSTFRGRLGYSVTPTLLLYGTGGLAVGGIKIGNQFICPTCAPPASTEASTAHQTTTTAVGWTLGGGLEWMLSPHWTVKAEYLYADLGKHSSSIAYAYGPSTSTMTSTARDTFNIARIGVNYKF